MKMLQFVRGALTSVTLAGVLYGRSLGELNVTALIRNPLSLDDPKTGSAVSCPDPAIIKERGHEGADTWYLYCTGDPLNCNDKDANGNLRNHSSLPTIA